SVIALKAENCPRQEGGEGGKCLDRKGGKVSGLEGVCESVWTGRRKCPGLEGGESVWTGRRKVSGLEGGGKCPDWKGGKVFGLEGGESVRTGRGGKCPDWKGVKSVRT
ncbi:unnamed protein product, partial [Staurois parvus]